MGYESLGTFSRTFRRPVRSQYRPVSTGSPAGLPGTTHPGASCSYQNAFLGSGQVLRYSRQEKLEISKNQEAWRAVGYYFLTNPERGKQNMQTMSDTIVHVADQQLAEEFYAGKAGF
jgi:hypothetical protein